MRTPLRAISQRKKINNFEIALWKEDRYFVAQCLNIDISSFGETEEEAISMLKDAILLYLEDHKNDIIKIEKPSIKSLSISY